MYVSKTRIQTYSNTPILSGTDGINMATWSAININTASKNTLTTLPGIGETKAQAIIDYRNEQGPFTHSEQLMEVSGIGEVTYDKIKDLITIYWTCPIEQYGGR